MKSNRLLANHFSSVIEFQNPNQYIEYLQFNNPKQLNAQNMEMIRLATNRYQQKWLKDQNLKLIILEKKQGKAFSVGGDVKSLYLDGINQKSDRYLINNFFLEEHTLDFYMSKLNKISISIWDGFVMGQGVGFSIHSNFRIATENSYLSMPEAKLGHFTDIGSSYFLPKLKKNLGFYLGLTGKPIKGQELVQVGLANYYIQSNQLQNLKNELNQLINHNSDQTQIEQIINKYSLDIDKTFQNENLIEKLFDFKTFQEFYQNLIQQNDPISLEIIKEFELQSPLSTRVIFDQLKKGASLNVQQCYHMDYNLCLKFADDTEFYEGVKSVLVDKNYKPNWKFKNFKSIDEEYIQKIFQNHDKQLHVW